jgi:spore maturation protein CgeB
MRVLFLESHPMWIHGLPNGFKDAGHEVKVSGPLTIDNIPRMISEFNPDLIVTMGWTPENVGEKVKWIRKYVKSSKVPLIYWATEDPAYTQCFSLPLIQWILPDFVFTICVERIDYYKKLGIKVAHLPFGYHESVHCRVDSDDKYKTSIAVVANGYPEYIKENPKCFRYKSLKTLINPLLKENIRIDFWGRYWDKMKPFVEYDIPSERIHGYLPYTEANKVYSSADIVIGLQNRQLAQRTYEILGSEGFCLTNDTLAVRQLFKNKRDLVISSSPNETVELVYYYLSHPEEREKICKQGKLAVSSHTYRNRAEYIIKTLKEQNILPSYLK